MKLTLRELAAALDATLVGDGDIVIEGLAEPASARTQDLALATRLDYAEALSEGAAQAALLWADANPSDYGLKGALLPTRPRFAMSALTRAADPGQRFGSGIHSSVVIDPTAHLGDNVQIGPFTVIGPEARIGDGSVIGPQCYIGAEAQLGPDAYLREQVSIGARVRIGARFIAQPGARIGSDGFSFVTEAQSNAELARETLDGDTSEAAAQPWHRLHSLGAVVIGDDVEVGANTAIDSGTIRPTQIGDGTKIDNIVHVGHNCVVGRNCLLCGCVGIAGSARIGNQVVLGGNVGVSDNVTIGDGVVAGGATQIFSNVPAGRSIWGSPATKMDSQIETYKALRRLPRLMRDIAALKKAVFNAASND